MVTAADVRALALALPEVTANVDPDRLAFSVAGKGIAWTWMERVRPKKPRRPRLDVLAVRCQIERKEMHGDEVTDLLNSVGLQRPDLDLMDDRTWPTV